VSLWVHQGEGNRTILVVVCTDLLVSHPTASLLSTDRAESTGIVRKPNQETTFIAPLSGASECMSLTKKNQIPSQTRSPP